MEKKHNFVYITTNLINKKQYIGSHATNDLNDSYLGSGRIFLKALRKYGRENFKREILHECETILDARKLEAPMIVQHQTMFPYGYNVHDNGGWGYPGSTHGPTTREKLRIANTGKKHSDETKEKIGIESRKRIKEKSSFFGKHHTEESIKKISENRRGITAGEKHHYFGKKREKDIREKISETLKGRSIPEEQKKKLSNSAKKVKKVICNHCGKEFTPWGIVGHKRSINKDI